MQLPAIDQEPLLYVAAAVVVVLALAAAVLAVLGVRRRRRRQRLERRFGAEYRHAVSVEGRRKAEEDLDGRLRDRGGFTPTTPDETARAELRRRMAALQYRFVDDPADVLLETQRVVTDALRACDYPVAHDRERALGLLSVDHPDLTPSLRTLLDGAYGEDVGRMRALFVDAKRALRDAVGVSFGVDDLHGEVEPTVAAAPAEPAPSAASVPQPPRSRDAPGEPSPGASPDASQAPPAEHREAGEAEGAPTR